TCSGAGAARSSRVRSRRLPIASSVRATASIRNRCVSDVRVIPSVSEGPGGSGGAPPVHTGPSLTLGMTVVVFVALRLVLFFDPALHLGWNSDAAVFGLMAKAIAAGREWPLYFWRQSYMGVMTSYIAAAFLHLVNAPAALRLASSLEV